MNRILILFAHPALQKSRVNRILISAVRGHEGVLLHDLYEAYPEFDIDIAFEQQQMEAHDVIVMHHPMFWYSTPAILKEWQDLVLQHGWAYGSNGSALRGKKLMNALTTGAREGEYHSDGHNGYTVRQLLVPIEQTANLCGMQYLPPFITYGTLRMTDQDIRQHAADYQRLILALRDDRIDWSILPDCIRINENLDRIITEKEGTAHA